MPSDLLTAFVEANSVCSKGEKSGPGPVTFIASHNKYTKIFVLTESNISEENRRTKECYCSKTNA